MTVTEKVVHTKLSRPETKRTRPLPAAKPLISTDAAAVLSTWSTFGVSFRTSGAGHGPDCVIETVTEAPTGMTPLNGMAGVNGLTSTVGWQNLSVASVGR